MSCLEITYHFFWRGDCKCRLKKNQNDISRFDEYSEAEKGDETILT